MFPNEAQKLTFIVIADIEEEMDDMTEELIEPARDTLRRCINFRDFTYQSHNLSVRVRIFVEGMGDAAAIRTCVTRFEQYHGNLDTKADTNSYFIYQKKTTKKQREF